jgi:mycothiol synthase
VGSPSPTALAPPELASVRDRVARIEARATAAGGHPALGDAVWRDLHAPRPDSAGFLLDELAYAHVARADNRAGPDWTLGVVAAPEARGSGARREVLAAALGHVRAEGGGVAVLWLPGATDADDRELATLGLRPDRDLYEMRVALPLRERPRLAPGVGVRSFEPGRDEEAWLVVNNRAFAGHAEQGGWSRETLERRMREPWFDPSLFLLAFDDAGLLGFNWMKVHPPAGADPVLGEIYVIGVDPRGQGTGLGRALAVAGLDAVAERGVTTGSLFCAAGNEPALRLYRSLGFAVHRTDRAYEAEVRS